MVVFVFLRGGFVGRGGRGGFFARAQYSGRRGLNQQLLFLLAHHTTDAYSVSVPPKLLGAL